MLAETEGGETSGTGLGMGLGAVVDAGAATVVSELAGKTSATGLPSEDAAEGVDGLQAVFLLLA